MHAIEKILAKAAGKDEVHAGEIVNCRIDFAEINDLYLQTIYSFYEMGGEKVWDKDKVAFVFDHYSPAPTINSAQIHKEMRQFAKEQGFAHHFDINTGVCHQVLAESGIVWPGMILVATDSHTTTHGAFGAFGTGIGATDMATVLISGELWFRVPEVIKIEINGQLQEGVYAKDVILHIIGKLKADAAVYKAIEFCGNYIENLDVADRMTICNMAVEMGAKTAYMKPNDKVFEYLSTRMNEEFVIEETDLDYDYSETYVFDVSKLSPQLAVPHSVDNVYSIENVDKVKINQAFIGSCTGGRIEDIEAAFKILNGKKIHPDTRLIIIPASTEVFQHAMKLGYIQSLVKAGATFASPGCGPCLGVHEGLLTEGEVCISATNRNFPGRMGSTGAKIYLASPACVAASALEGKITDPRELLKEAKENA
ncbi:3-isopropylmalate dehydratase large subunit 1 [Tepidanaerobacter acetatoxydans Re1]|uniref:3-isopropylmalate dehydratase large subunit n=1 Tax=Tepidanaerobacter acetatoxydans (strain DSM 21804 / JCM 16047 / Re1) TaxID=1209989 RepID=F4LSM1_TEPAE|nr:3-isopropylmalate dehydratase large subunit [Tepidanaerobacter acetatoxydans]AEE92411.1 3-isopropylmalate dehydratase large subunit [Tepidanaerobacter acetatoxydans Re1]CCP27313.1 3-isopropylmalate dehydratase large subunit 1 [Tepidanaerobacter acetatoxydans Re1]